MKKYLLYRVWYAANEHHDEIIIYLGRTMQPLQTRIRAHLFKAPNVRNLKIDLISKVDYAEFKSQADMYLYEIYYINKFKPFLNQDDKAKDGLTVVLPEVDWTVAKFRLWDKWKKQIAEMDAYYKREKEAKLNREFELRRLRANWHSGQITEDDYWRERARLEGKSLV